MEFSSCRQRNGGRPHRGRNTTRGGADQFNITIFGDEPYGNYNRILLSDVLNGSQDESEIYLNPLDWYVENDIKLTLRRNGR